MIDVVKKVDDSGIIVIIIRIMVRFSLMERLSRVKLALHGGTRPRATTPTHPHALPLFNERWASRRINMEGHFTPGSIVSCVIYKYLNLLLNYFFVYIIVHTDEEICEWNELFLQLNLTFSQMAPYAPTIDFFFLLSWHHIF